MESLIELVGIVTKRGRKKIELFSLDNENEKNKGFDHSFFRKIRTGAILNDIEGEKISNAHGKRFYRMFKSRFRQRLFNHFFFLDLNKTKTEKIIKAEYFVMRNVALLQILITLGAHKTVWKFGQEVLENAIKHQMTQAIQIISRLLIIIAAQRGDSRKLNYFMKLNENSTYNLSEELLLANLYSSVTCQFTSSYSHKPYLANEIRKVTRRVEAKGLLEKVNSYAIHLYYYRLKIAQFQINRNYYSCVHYCTKFSNYLNNNPLFNTKKNSSDVAKIMMDSFCHLGNYTKAMQIGAEYVNVADKRVNYWFYFAEYYIQCLLKLGKYIEANNMINEFENNSLYGSRPANTLEKIKIFKAWLSFISEAGVDAEFTKIYGLTKKIRMTKLLNDLPIFSMDKGGLNANLLILQYMYYIIRGNFSEAISRSEPLKKYVARNLRHHLNERTVIYIKMLRMAEIYSFNYPIVYGKTKRYYELLIDPNLPKSGLDDMEVIDYSLLWELVLKKLKEMS